MTAKTKKNAHKGGTAPAKKQASKKTGQPGVTKRPAHRGDSVPPDVVAKFGKKYDEMRNGLHPEIGAAGSIRKLPDGGWQMDCGDSATIAMAPGTDTPFAVMGAIRTKWLEEGGAFNEVGVPGKLGYPVSDERPYTSMGRPADRISSFQKGDITWNSAKNECYVALNEPSRAAPEGTPSITAFIDELSLEEKFAALKKLVAAIEEETENLMSRLDDSEDELNEAEEALEKAGVEREDSDAD